MLNKKRVLIFLFLIKFSSPQTLEKVSRANRAFFAVLASELLWLQVAVDADEQWTLLEAVFTDFLKLLGRNTPQAFAPPKSKITN